MYTTFFRVWARSLLTYQDLPMVHMCDLMAPDYLAYQIFLHPRDVGFAGLSRPRTFVYFCHQETCEYKADLYENLGRVTKTLSSFVHTKPSDYRVSTPSARQLDCMEMSRKRKIVFRHDLWLRWLVS